MIHLWNVTNICAFKVNNVTIVIVHNILWYCWLKGVDYHVCVKFSTIGVGQFEGMSLSFHIAFKMDVS